jgi:exo beta-1,2-glucooligosaccharide sophorohydrolase (non-reducing end)
MKYRFGFWLVVWASLFLRAGSVYAKAPAGVTNLVVVGHDSRIDLRWTASGARDVTGYRVYRAKASSGPFEQIAPARHQPNVYSDFIGANERLFYYRVTAVGRDGGESVRSKAVSGRSRAMTDEQLLTSVQEATFRYFWDGAHPVSGLIRERFPSRGVCTIGGTGFGLMVIAVGAERKFVSRAAAAGRVRKMLTFLEERAQRYHGAWSHWLDGATGKTRPFSKYDDGGDLVETALLIQGMLTVRQYFDRNDPVETNIRSRATRLWREVDWKWYLQKPAEKVLLWHWSPKHKWKINLAVRGFNECMITYLLAIASPTHPIPANCYYDGWAGNGRRYVNGNKYYGYTQPVGRQMGGPLFFTHYSFLGFDPRGRQDKFCNYFVNNRNITLIHRAYSIANPGKFKDYGPNVWGLTASYTAPRGYKAHGPGRADNGTISPTACISAMPYAPKESLAAMKHLYHTYGKQLWGPFGFRDAFNPSLNWFSKNYLALDQGTMVIMIENHRTGLLWKKFMSNPEIAPMLKAIGWRNSPAGGGQAKP